MEKPVNQPRPQCVNCSQPARTNESAHLWEGGHLMTIIWPPQRTIMGHLEIITPQSMRSVKQDPFEVWYIAQFQKCIFIHWINLTKWFIVMWYLLYSMAMSASAGYRCHYKLTKTLHTSPSWYAELWSFFVTILEKHYHVTKSFDYTTLIAKFMGPTWGPSGAARTQVGLMLSPWTLLSGHLMPWQLIKVRPTVT